MRDTVYDSICSQKWVAGEVGNATLVVPVSGHQDVTTVTPPTAPTEMK